MKKKQLLKLLEKVGDNEDINVIDSSCDDGPEEYYVTINTIKVIDGRPYIYLDGENLDPNMC